MALRSGANQNTKKHITIVLYFYLSTKIHTNVSVEGKRRDLLSLHGKERILFTIYYSFEPHCSITPLHHTLLAPLMGVLLDGVLVDYLYSVSLFIFKK